MLQFKLHHRGVVGLSATKRLSLISLALWTTPMPPPPSFSMMAIVGDGLADRGATPCYARCWGKSMTANKFGTFGKVSCRLNRHFTQNPNSQANRRRKLGPAFGESVIASLKHKPANTHPTIDTRQEFLTVALANGFIGWPPADSQSVGAKNVGPF